MLLTLVTVVAFNLLMGQPPKIIFTAKTGNVTFDHVAHQKRANGDCAACHDKLFPKSSAAIKLQGRDAQDGGDG